MYYCYFLFSVTLDPTVTATTSDMTAIPDQTRTFKCSFTGVAIPYWVVNGVGDSPIIITNGNPVLFFTVSISGTEVQLKVMEIDQSLNGTTYVCQINFVGGTVVSDPAALTVYGKYSPILHRATAIYVQVHMHALSLCETLYLVCTPFVYKTTSSAVCRHSPTHTATHPSIPTHTHTRTHARAHARAHTRTHARTRTHAHTFTYIHGRMHAITPMVSWHLPRCTGERVEGLWSEG